MTEKKCNKCGEIKDLSEFCKNKNNKDGLNTWCRSCVRENQRKYNETNRRREIDYDNLDFAEKKCSKCSEIKSLDEFYKSKLTKDGFDYYCKACGKIEYFANRDHILEQQKEYNAKNKEKRAAQRREYYENNREELLEYGRQWNRDNREHRSQQAREYRENNREKVAETRRRYYEANKERIIKSQRQWVEEHREHVAKRQRQWRQDNNDRLTEQSKQYYRNNTEKSLARSVKRRALEKSTATNDPWELAEISLFYSDCPDGYDVDHIIPLFLGGCHELSNLQHLERSLNRSKWVKHPDDWDDPRPISCRA